MNHRDILLVAGAALALAAGCGRRPGDPGRIVLATTTSVRDCGLLDVLIPAFERETGIRVAPIAVGSGEALRMGRDGNADLLLVHDPEGEAALQADGFVARDEEILRSRFVLVGPAADPAGVAGRDDAAAVFRALGTGAAPFVSRGDDSGTHRRERRLWAAAGVQPEGRPWYVSVGAGMMHALRVANERQAYCLTDLATWLAGKPGLDLALLVDSDGADWANLYSVLLLSPERFGSRNHEGARRFLDFVTRGAGREILRRFGEAEFGHRVFTVPPDP
ncbi:MAG: solute-binding protein [Myxococcales bacterium]|nr:solute-binding protein [Myxococcales bacterium]